MSGVTDDPTDPRITRGGDTEPRPQSEVYLVLSEAERAKGFVRPVRTAYVHVGPPGPQYPLLDLTPEQDDRYPGSGYVKFEAYPESESPKLGRYWKQYELDKVERGCGAVTHMGLALSETYARDPKFYGSTYCVHCQMHLPVGEFLWDGTDQRVGS